MQLLRGINKLLIFSITLSLILHTAILQLRIDQESIAKKISANNNIDVVFSTLTPARIKQSKAIKKTKKITKKTKKKVKIVKVKKTKSKTKRIKLIKRNTTQEETLKKISSTEESPKRIEPAKENIQHNKATSKKESQEKHIRKGNDSINIKNYINKILTIIEKHKYYPKIARLRSIEGRVKIGFTLNPSGKLEDVVIIKSSGSKILDKAALKTIKEASRYFPSPPTKEKLTLKLDIYFILEE